MRFAIPRSRFQGTLSVYAAAFVALLPAAAGRRFRRRMRGLLLNENETPHPGPLPAAAGRGGTIERFFSLVPPLRDASGRDDRFRLMKKLLIVEDKESLALMLKETVEAEGLEADVASNGAEAMRTLASGRRYFAVLTDLRLPGADGISVLKQVKESDPDCAVIVMTAFGTIENAVEAMKLGAFDFIEKPIDVDHLILLLRRCREHRELIHENLLLKEEFQQRYRLPAIIGESPQIVEVSQAIQRVAPTDSTVLLQGESGHGQGALRPRHPSAPPRRDRPFVAINCAAIPDTLIESELFGHEKGAFTGADGAADRASSSSPTAGRCSSTRSATSPPPCRPRSCASCRSGRSSASEGPRRSRSTCASSAPRTATSPKT